VIEIRFPWESDRPPVAANATLPAASPSPKPRGRRPATLVPPVSREAAGWLYHHLTIHGPVPQVADFAEAARGSGVVPWQLDYGQLEEDIFNLAASQPAAQRSLSIAGCRILARQFRERVEARQARAVALVGHSRACPLDLHGLLPVPPGILHLGPNHPVARSWLVTHWGTTDRLRQVAEREWPTTGRRLPAGHAVIGYGFFTAGDTPCAAMTHLGKRWPTLRFVLRPAD
jgi:hypothetical protein